MCGIAGFAAERADQEHIDRLLDALRARGPDGAGARRVGDWQLVNTRLAVVDLSDRVRYPMANEAQDLWLVFNGEIYNHIELRRELQGRGHRFATSCDAEVVLHGYEQWGVDVFGRLNGMWALALVEQRTGSLLLARDALGIKPLVRTTGRRFAFASNAHALVAAGLADAQIDREAIEEFLAFHYVPSPRTGLAGVEQVAPGTWIRRATDGTEATGRWSQPPVFDDGADPVALTDADDVFAGAVRRQLAADVDVGVLLSGGLDSALLLAYAVDAGHRPRAFTLGFGGYGDYDEGAEAARVAAGFGVEHTVEQFEGSFVDAITAVADAYDGPFADPSALATLQLAGLARRDVSVVLSGTGADDLFGGYYRHRAGLLRALTLAPRPLRARAARAHSDRGGERSTRLRQLRSYGVRAARSSLEPARDRYLSIVGCSTSADALAALTWPADLEHARTRVAQRHGLAASRSGELGHIQQFELATYLAGDLLVKEDRATMSCGLEGRVPFLDADILALAQRTPRGQRASLRGNKILMRRLAKRHLGHSPPRRKRGFAVPLGPLLAGPWRVEASAWLRERSSALVDGVHAAALLDASATAPLDVWALCALLAWEERTERLRAGSSSGNRSCRSGL